MDVIGVGVSPSTETHASAAVILVRQQNPRQLFVSFDQHIACLQTLIKKLTF